MTRNIWPTTSSAYIATVTGVLRYGIPNRSRGLSHLELHDHQFTVLRPSSDPITTRDPELNAKIADYTRKEFELYDSGTNDAAEFARHAKLWDGIRNPDGSVNSAYGYLIWRNRCCGHEVFGSEFVTPWEWARRKLAQDRGTRQAILRFSLPSHQWEGNKDQVCTMHGCFRVRGNSLDLSIVMRSNDVRRGLVYDMPWFCSLIPRMRDELKDVYPDLAVGLYTHFAHSMHLYERDIQDARLMIGDAT